MLLPQDYCELIKYDRPDLIARDQSVGIEVTQVLREHEKEDAHFFSKKLSKKHVDSLEETDLRKFYKHGNECLTGDAIKPEWKGRIIGYSSPFNGTNYEGFKKQVRKKYMKINEDQYTKCKSFDLYVFWSEPFEEELSAVCSSIKEVAAEFREQYRSVFVDLNGFVIRYDSLNGCLTKYDTSDTVHEIAEKAKAVALGSL